MADLVDQETLLNDCFAAVQEFKRTDENRNSKLVDSLSKILQFSRVSENGSLKAICKEKGIHDTKRTNRFTLLVKLFFGKDEDKSNISRYASVLSFADREKIEPTGLSHFIKEHRGIVKCCRESRRSETEGGTQKPTHAPAASVDDDPLSAVKASIRALDVDQQQHVWIWLSEHRNRVFGGSTSSDEAPNSCQRLLERPGRSELIAGEDAAAA